MVTCSWATESSSWHTLTLISFPDSWTKVAPSAVPAYRRSPRENCQIKKNVQKKLVKKKIVHGARYKTNVQKRNVQKSNVQKKIYKKQMYKKKSAVPRKLADIFRLFLSIAHFSTFFILFLPWKQHPASDLQHTVRLYMQRGRRLRSWRRRERGGGRWRPRWC